MCPNFELALPPWASGTRAPSGHGRRLEAQSLLEAPAHSSSSAPWSGRAAAGSLCKSAAPRRGLDCMTDRMGLAEAGPGPHQWTQLVHISIDGRAEARYGPPLAASAARCRAVRPSSGPAQGVRAGPGWPDRGQSSCSINRAPAGSGGSSILEELHSKSGIRCRPGFHSLRTADAPRRQPRSKPEAQI